MAKEKENRRVSLDGSGPDPNIVDRVHCSFISFVDRVAQKALISLCPGFLIHARSNMDLLLREGIIVKRPIGDIMATLPNDTCTNISSWNINKEYHDICEVLTKFCSKHWYYVLTTTLRRIILPWKGAASIGAIILLLLTLVQTVHSVLQTYKQFKNES